MISLNGNVNNGSTFGGPAGTQEQVLPNLKMAFPQPKTEGEWLVIKPSAKTWSDLQKIQAFADQKLGDISTWARSDLEHAHLTLYMGFQSRLSLTQKKLLMQEIAERVSKVQPFTVSIPTNKAEIENGGKFVVVKFDDAKLQHLRGEVKKAIEIFKQKQQEKLEINAAWDEKPFIPHFTIGTLDVDKEMVDNHRNGVKGHCKTDKNCCPLSQLRFKTGKIFKETFEQKAKSGEFGTAITLPVDEVVLMGADDFNAKRKDKRYYDLASARLGVASAVKDVVSPAKPAAVDQLTVEVSKLRLASTQTGLGPLAKLKAKFQTILGKSPNAILIPFTEWNGHVPVNYVDAVFENASDAKRILESANVGTKVWEEGGKYRIRLGQKRFEGLFGSTGSKILEECSRALYLEKQITTCMAKSLRRDMDRAAVKFEIHRDEAQKPTVHAYFADRNMASEILKNVGGGELHYDSKSQLHFIRLGEKRLERLYLSSLSCNSNEGTKAYSTVCSLAG